MGRGVWRRRNKPGGLGQRSMGNFLFFSVWHKVKVVFWIDGGIEMGGLDMHDVRNIIAVCFITN